MRRAFEAQLAARQHRHARAQIGHVIDDVGGQDHHHVLANARQQVEEAVALFRIEARGGFVDDDQFGLADQRLRNAEALAQMQPHAILINIARGDVIEEAALVAHLAAGKIAGAGLDVYEREPQISPALLQMQNVTLLPHLGTAVEKVRVDMGMMALENLIAHLEGGTLPNAV